MMSISLHTQTPVKPHYRCSVRESVVLYLVKHTQFIPHMSYFDVQTLTLSRQIFTEQLWHFSLLLETRDTQKGVKAAKDLAYLDRRVSLTNALICVLHISWSTLTHRVLRTPCPITGASDSWAPINHCILNTIESNRHRARGWSRNIWVQH